MTEVISEDQPRIKFQLTRTDSSALPDAPKQLSQLSGLMAEMEQLGAAPLLADGKVGGNFCIRLSTVSQHEKEQHDQTSMDGNTVLVSKSGKDAGRPLQACDFVQVASFDRDAWRAEYLSPTEDIRPSSDTPLLCSCLSREAQQRYGWHDLPNVAVHGHALESGAGKLCLNSFPYVFLGKACIRGARATVQLL